MSLERKFEFGYVNLTVPVGSDRVEVKSRGLNYKLNSDFNLMPVQTSNSQWASTSSDCIMRSKWVLLATLTFDFNSPLFSLSRQKGPDAYAGKSTSPKVPDFSYCPMTGLLHIVVFYEISHLSSLPLPGVSCALQFFIQPLQSTAWRLDGAATSISLSSLSCGEALQDAGCWLTACATASSHVSVGC